MKTSFGYIYIVKSKAPSSSARQHGTWVLTVNVTCTTVHMLKYFTEQVDSDF